MIKLKKGNLVEVKSKNNKGIGYIDCNGSEDENILIIGISWKSGGVTNISIQDAISYGYELTKIKIEKK